MKSTRKTFSLLFLVLLTANGCGTILVAPFFPRTGAHGIVLNEEGQPVANAPMYADWMNPSMGWIILPPQCGQFFRTDSHGKWTFYKRDAEEMDIGPYRWTDVGTRAFLCKVGPLKSGERLTNEVIFRIKAAELPSEADQKKWNP